MITQRYIRDVLLYNPQEGTLRGRHGHTIQWRNTSHGTQRLELVGLLYKATDLIWIYEYGFKPSKAIIHLDGNRGNLAMSNLAGEKRRPVYDYGRIHTGVTFHRTTGKWIAHYNNKHLGLFKTIEEGVAARARWMSSISIL